MAEIMSRPFKPAAGFCWACVFGGADHDEGCTNYDQHHLEMAEGEGFGAQTHAERNEG